MAVVLAATIGTSNNSSADSVLNLEVSTQEGSAAVVDDATGAAGAAGGGESLVLGHAVEHITSRHHDSCHNRQATLSWQSFVSYVSRH